MRRPMLIALALAAPIAAQAADSPAWDAARVCLDRNLSDMLPARETAETLFRAVRAACAPQIETAEAGMMADLGTATPDVVTAVRRRVEEGLFAYVVRFKAAGRSPGAL